MLVAGLEGIPLEGVSDDHELITKWAGVPTQELTRKLVEEYTMDQVTGFFDAIHADMEALCDDTCRSPSVP